MLRVKNKGENGDRRVVGGDYNIIVRPVRLWTAGGSESVFLWKELKLTF